MSALILFDRIGDAIATLLLPVILFHVNPNYINLVETRRGASLRIRVMEVSFS
ncbi:hypothetical protein VB735_26400 [Halotia wernerae UHCC 0503]|nr:hypothetical protein [Halotia wernerae UHCC 0503]